MKLLLIQLLLIVSILLNCSEKATVLSGPMVGGVAMRSALVWVQLDYRKDNFPDTLGIEIRIKSNSELGNNSLSVMDENQASPSYPSITRKKFLSSAKVNPRTGIATFEIQDLEPGMDYHYEVVGYPNASGRFRTKPLWKFREPLPPDFSFIIASCHYVNEEPYDRRGKPWGDGYEIFQAIEKENSDFFLWMGDNVYLREADWDSPSGILHRFSHTRALPESRNVFARMAHFAIWDDHDYGPNDASRSYSLGNVVDGIQKEFWPDFNYPDKGVYRNFTWGDAEFFLLDNRRFRSANRNLVDSNQNAIKGNSSYGSTAFGKRTILGEKQLDWLFQALADSNARFKFIVMGGQFLNSAAVYENYANYSEERQLIMDTIRKLKLENVVFLTGDRHHSEISVIRNDGRTMPNGSRSSANTGFEESGSLKNAIHEFTVSPITAGIPSTPVTEKNIYRVPRSLFQERLYGLVSIRTVEKSRQLQIQFKNSKGETIYSYKLE